MKKEAVAGINQDTKSVISGENDRNEEKDINEEVSQESQIQLRKRKGSICRENGDRESRSFSSMSLTSKMILSYSILVCMMLILVLGYLLHNQIQHNNTMIEQKITEMSESLSENPIVRHGLETGAFNQEEMDYLKKVNESFSYVDYIVVVNKQDLRLYHREAERIGKKFEGGDEGEALAGHTTYVTEGKGSKLYQLRAFSSVYGSNGEVLGFVLVSTYTSTVNDLSFQNMKQFGNLFLLTLIIGIAFASLIAANIRKSLLGYDPNQFRELYLQKVDVLNSLEEGLIATDDKGSCIYCNDAARNIFKSQEELEQFIQAQLCSYDRQLESDGYQQNQRIRFGENEFLISTIPVMEQQKHIGMLALLRNRTEVNELAEELTGVKHIIGALRATTHEQKNKMHVIMGLLQMGDTEAAMEYISNINTSDYDSISAIYDRIENRTIAALLCGKQNRANELDIKLTLQKSSHLDAHNVFISANDLVTIVGNLIENAFEALKDFDGVREINIFLYNDQQGITIIVDDTGPGISPENLERIRTSKFSTKGPGHGIGLSLIKGIVAQAQGTLEIESELGEGSSFSITFTQERSKAR